MIRPERAARFSHAVKAAGQSPPFELHKLLQGGIIIGSERLPRKHLRPVFPPAAPKYANSENIALLAKVRCPPGPVRAGVRAPGRRRHFTVPRS